MNNKDLAKQTFMADIHARSTYPCNDKYICED